MCDSGEKSDSKGLNAINIAVRISGMALSVASAALMATASQCTVVLQYGAAEHTVSYKDFGPFVYLVAANAIAAILVGIAIFLSVWKKGKAKCSRVLLPIMDAAVPALLYSSTGAAFAAGEYMSYCTSGGRRVGVCGGAIQGTNNFCSQVHLAMYLSLAAAAAVSAAEVVKNVPLAMSFGGSGCSDDSGSESGCDHGCHHKH